MMRSILFLSCLTSVFAKCYNESYHGFTADIILQQNNFSCSKYWYDYERNEAPGISLGLDFCCSNLRREYSNQHNGTFDYTNTDDTFNYTNTIISGRVRLIDSDTCTFAVENFVFIPDYTNTSMSMNLDWTHAWDPIDFSTASVPSTANGTLNTFNVTFGHGLEAPKLYLSSSQKCKTFATVTLPPFPEEKNMNGNLNSGSGISSSGFQKISFSLTTSLLIFSLLVMFSI